MKQRNLQNRLLPIHSRLRKHPAHALLLALLLCHLLTRAQDNYFHPAAVTVIPYPPGQSFDLVGFGDLAHSRQFDRAVRTTVFNEGEMTFTKEALQINQASATAGERNKANDNIAHATDLPEDHQNSDPDTAAATFANGSVLTDSDGDGDPM